MPSKSKVQKRTMRAIAHGWRPGKGPIAKIPVKVAKAYTSADKAKSRKRTIAEGS